MEAWVGDAPKCRALYLLAKTGTLGHTHGGQTTRRHHGASLLSNRMGSLAVLMTSWGGVACFCGDSLPGSQAECFAEQMADPVALPKAAQFPEFPTLAWWVTSHL